MRGSINVAEGATPTTLLAIGTAWSVGVLHNASDATVYYQFTRPPTGGDATLSTTNGLPLAAGASVSLVYPEVAQVTPGALLQPAVLLVHGGSGNKAVRYAFA